MKTEIFQFFKFHLNNIIGMPVTGFCLDYYFFLVKRGYQCNEHENLPNFILRH